MLSTNPSAEKWKPINDAYIAKHSVEGVLVLLAMLLQPGIL